jgi:hypothetical protein
VRAISWIELYFKEFMSTESQNISFAASVGINPMVLNVWCAELPG